MMQTPLSEVMMWNLDTNQNKWDQLLHEEKLKKAKLEAEQQQQRQQKPKICAYPPPILLDDTDTISIGVAEIAAEAAHREDNLALSEHSVRSVRIESNNNSSGLELVVEQQASTEASEMVTSPGSPGEPSGKVRGDKNSGAQKKRFGLGDSTDEDLTMGGANTGASGLGSEFLGVPQPYARRHSIATGLMGSNIQLPAGLLSAASGSGSSLNLSELNIPGDSTTTTRMVGRTVIRRESLPGRAALPTTHILHLQKICSSGASSAGSMDDPEGEVTTESVDVMEVQPSEFEQRQISPIISPSKFLETKSSCSSCSTTEEILDIAYTLPDNSMASSPSKRLSRDFDELCPATSILSMSPRVAQVNLEQSSEMEDSRRVLIRQQTCPVVSIFAKDKSGLSRPRFLSAAAAVNPSVVASSSILSSHRARNRSPEAGNSKEGGGSTEAVHGSSSSCYEVISEEAERASGGESAEASPLEIYVKQFPPVKDDNDGEPSRHGSGSNLDILEEEELQLQGCRSFSCKRQSFQYCGLDESRMKCESSGSGGFEELMMMKLSSQNKETEGATTACCCRATQTEELSGSSSCWELMNTGVGHTNDVKLTDTHNEDGWSSSASSISATMSALVDKLHDMHKSMISCATSTSDNDEDEDPSAPCNEHANSSSVDIMWTANRLWKSLNDEGEEIIDPCVHLDVDPVADIATTGWILAHQAQSHQVKLVVLLVS